MKISFSGNNLFIDDTKKTLDYPIHTAFLNEKLIIVLFDPTSKKHGCFNNLIALTKSGVKAWEASLPTNQSSDAYYKVHLGHPLIADSYSSFRCMISPKDGKIIEKEFHK